MEESELRNALHRVCGFINAEPLRAVSHHLYKQRSVYPWTPKPFYVNYDDKYLELDLESAYEIITTLTYLKYSNLFKELLKATTYVITNISELKPSKPEYILTRSIVNYVCNEIQFDKIHSIKVSYAIPDKTDEQYDSVMEMVDYEIQLDIVCRIVPIYDIPTKIEDTMYLSCLALFTKL